MFMFCNLLSSFCLYIFAYNENLVQCAYIAWFACRPDDIGSVLCGPSFRTDFAVKDIIEHWISILASLGKVRITALEKILQQKQRAQQEMHKYLSLKQTHKDSNMTDYQKKFILLFKVMSRHDPEEIFFCILDLIVLSCIISSYLCNNLDGASDANIQMRYKFEKDTNFVNSSREHKAKQPQLAVCSRMWRQYVHI
ncbi:hypothetical protein Cgig2_005380 [Carnegiea gigantea]|uniref:Uncharacterized protein n=1 Tax=Carnegiea gigantea TaxID=171969 RepID=A0A9Q1K6A6_9CARY|nr:hypothetical protein Cgig2_005380 [Carnegiea gigantea]